MSADIQVPRMEVCDRCNGTGTEPGTRPATCPTCNGRGEILYQQSFLSIRRTCHTCGGRGQIIRNPCSQCHGQGYRQAVRKIKINIPAGVDEGTRLRLARKASPAAQRGPPRRPVCLAEGEGAPVLRAPAKRPALHHPGEHRAGRAGRRNRGAHARSAATPETPRGDPERLAVPLPQQRSPARQRQRPRRSLRPRQREGAIQLTREQRRLFEQLRDTLPVDNQPTEKSLLGKVKDYFM